MIRFTDLTKIEEIKSTYEFGALADKFKKFVEYCDNLGLSVEDVKLDLVMGGSDTEEEEEFFDDVALDSGDESSVQEVPSVWVLVEDKTIPVFKPVKDDAFMVDVDRALDEYGMDIVVLKSVESEKIRTLKINYSGVRLECEGTKRSMRAFIINSFEYPECRGQLLAKLEDLIQDEEAVDSFMLEIPSHKEHIIMGIKN
jgi:hypothetical protein